MYKIGVTASAKGRCRRCGYIGRLVTQDCYKRRFSSECTYRGGYLRCPNPGCLTQSEFMKRRRFDVQVTRLYEWDPLYDEARADMLATIALQFPETVIERLETAS